MCYNREIECLLEGTDYMWINNNDHILTITNDDQQEVMLEVSGLYIFQGLQVMEAFTSNKNECFYLFFYKNKFITGKRTTKMRRKSTLYQLVTQGAYLTSPSPIIHSILAQNDIHSFPALNLTWKKLKKTYNQVECAHILTSFDSYLKRDSIISILKDMCLQFKRDGDFLQAYRILQIIVERYPLNLWANDLIRHMDFQKYSIKYQSKIESLLSYDPLHSENQLYLQMNSSISFEILLEKLHSESRQLECVALYCHKLSLDSENFEYYFPQLLDILSANFSKQESISILYNVYENYLANSVVNKEKIQEHLLNQLFSTMRYKEAFFILTQCNRPLSIRQIDSLILSIKNLEPSYSPHLDDFQASILINANANQLEELTTLLIPWLLEKDDIHYLYYWLKPLFQQLPYSLVETIKTMYKIKEEPDQQHYMGELYYQFNQLPQAIECFLWDVELNPTNPRPIKWLTKLYSELGMVEESISYQYLYKEVQKSS